MTDERWECHDCSGTGILGEDLCHYCEGWGYFPTPKDTEDAS